MKSRIGLLFAAIFIGFAGCSAPETESQSPQPAQATGSQASLQLEDLFTSQLERVENTEVVVSRVTIPPNMSLPKHWHPGEEFAYVLEGSTTLWQDGKADVVVKKGEVIRVPLRQVHTAMTSEEGATVLVFRVHELGQPQRTLVE